MRLSRQRDLWGNPIVRIKGYYVFHDESIPNKRWFIIGLLFVPEKKVLHVREILKKIKLNGGYNGEIHFSKLPSKYTGKWGKIAKITKEWLNLFPLLARNDYIYFSALIVDRKSPKYDHSRFSKDFHEYNRFTAMTLKAGIFWHLPVKELDEVKIAIISDKKDRVFRPDEGVVDNFEEYIPYKVEMDYFSKFILNDKYPKIHVSISLKDSSEDILLQYCDLLLGATQAALTGNVSNTVKRELAKKLLLWHNDLKNPLREQQYKLYRKLNIWLFPDKNGRPSNDIPFNIKLINGSLFDINGGER